MLRGLELVEEEVEVVMEEEVEAVEVVMEEEEVVMEEVGGGGPSVLSVGSLAWIFRKLNFLTCNKKREWKKAHLLPPPSPS